MILRRLYLYLVSAAAIGLLAGGLVRLGTTILLFVFNSPDAQDSRISLAAFTAMVLVALPVWGIHFWFARRFARRDVAERASAIRRLYFYAVCLATAVGAALALDGALVALLAPILDASRFDGLTAAQAGWAALVLAAVWGLHFWIAARDRAAAGEVHASATLRRWYAYVALLVGLLMFLSGAADLIHLAWLKAISTSSQYVTLTESGRIGTSLAIAAGLLLAGLILWSFHAVMVSRRPVLDDDRKSTLRALEGFLVVGYCIGSALFAASQILYYAVARSLGISDPGGLGGNVAAGLAGPVSMLGVYGVAWFFVRRRLARDAEGEEAARQAGIRRLYVNLVCLVSLAALGAGAAGLLWFGSEQLVAPLIGVTAQPWKDPVSLYVTLLVAGAAVWVAHWRHAPPAAGRQSLSRRLYVYAALLGSVLIILGGGVGILNAVFQQVFSLHPHLDDPANLDFGHYAGVLLVAMSIAAYHWGVLRRDAAARPPREQKPVEAASTPTEAAQLEVTVAGASEEDLRKALASLPAGSSYSVRRSDQAPDQRADR